MGKLIFCTALFVAKYTRGDVPMPDYEAMYKQLFNAVTDAARLLQEAQQTTNAIKILQEAQREAEEIFISAEKSDEN